MPSPQFKVTARRDSWKTLPLPEARASLDFKGVYTTEEFARIQQGLIPESMEDKWFVFYEGAWLYLCRSWTGACIYGLRFESTSAGTSVVESWVSRDPTQYTVTRIDYDRAMLRFLIDALLLGKDVAFPVPSDLPANMPAGAYQHHLVGQAHPEAAHPSDKQCSRSLWDRILRWLGKRGDAA